MASCHAFLEIGNSFNFRSKPNGHWINNLIVIKLQFHISIFNWKSKKKYLKIATHHQKTKSAVSKHCILLEYEYMIKFLPKTSHHLFQPLLFLWIIMFKVCIWLGSQCWDFTKSIVHRHRFYSPLFYFYQPTFHRLNLWIMICSLAIPAWLLDSVTDSTNNDIEIWVFNFEKYLQFFCEEPWIFYFCNFCFDIEGGCKQVSRATADRKWRHIFFKIKNDRTNMASARMD